MTPHALARELNQMSDRAAIQFIRDRLADMAVDVARLEKAKIDSAHNAGAGGKAPSGEAGQP